MDEKLIDEILDAVLPPIEAAESQTAALIQFLRDRGILTDDDFARFQEQAENASEIKSRAMRLRLKRILASINEEMAKLRKQVEEAAKQTAAQGENPEHRARKEGPPTKEEAAKQEQKPREISGGLPEEPRVKPPEHPKKEEEQKKEETQKKEEAPAARDERERQEPRKKAS